MEIEQVLSEWDIDCKIDPIHIDQSSIDIPKMHSKYIRYYSDVLKQLKKSEKELEALKHIKTRYYQGKLTKQELDNKKWNYDPFDGEKPPLKSEIYKWVNIDKDIIHKDNIVEDLKTHKEVLKEILEHIKWRAQNIRNIIDYRKFKAGE